MLESAAMPKEKEYFDIDRAAVARYFTWMPTIMLLVIGIWFFGIGLLLAILYGLLIAPWLSLKQADALEYWLEGTTLRVDSGVYFFKRKSIPLDRVTDVILAQGPLQRAFGIWVLNIQTAGSGQQIPEAVLYGIFDAEAVRDRIIEVRDSAVLSSKRNHGL